ncbi:MAG: low molecular weight phosphatase family protein [Methylococcaceae bacterium]|nr:low molecular weight phosphatase family protein [Methylococcaceae bacterium]
MTTDHSQILFLCTGNYYRSRFAEHLFNHHAPGYQLPWKAFSRGLAIEMVGEDSGPISLATLIALQERGIPINGEIRSPIALTEQDLKTAHHIVALKHAEHHPLMSRKFPNWVDKVEYWHVHDIDFASPAQALPEIEESVQRLLVRFTNQIV